MYRPGILPDLLYTAAKTEANSMCCLISFTTHDLKKNHGLMKFDEM